MTYHVRRQFAAWLGLIAMCLVAFAPSVSHFVRAARTLTVPVCTVEGPQGEHYRINLFSRPMPATGVAPTMTAMAMTVSGRMDDMPGMHHGPAAETGTAGHADHDSKPMDDCGYCDLLNHVPTIATVPPAPLAPLLLLFGAFVLPALTRYTPLGAFPSGRPRAPPAVS